MPKKAKKFYYMDYGILIPYLVLSVFGVIMAYSASSYRLVNQLYPKPAGSDAIKEAASILESQGAKYRNLSIDSDSAAGKYASDIMAFPTTILVDRNGNIVGEPMLGGIDNQDNYDTLMKQIQSVLDQN